MTSHRDPKNARGKARKTTKRLSRVLRAAMLLAGISSWVAACATAETITYGDGDCIGAACQQGAVSSSSSSSSGSGGNGGSGGATGSTTTSTMCVVDPNCTVKWGADIYTAMFDQPTTGCTAMSLCHGSGKGGITLEPAKAHEAYLALKDYMLLDMPGPAKKYIVPCDKAASGILCNAKPESGMTNPFGACGSLMPLLGTNLTMAQVNKIADWIACGAPEN